MGESQLRSPRPEENLLGPGPTAVLLGCRRLGLRELRVKSKIPGPAAWREPHTFAGLPSGTPTPPRRSRREKSRKFQPLLGTRKEQPVETPPGGLCNKGPLFRPPLTRARPHPASPCPLRRGEHGPGPRACSGQGFNPEPVESGPASGPRRETATGSGTSP